MYINRWKQSSWHNPFNQPNAQLYNFRPQPNAKFVQKWELNLIRKGGERLHFSHTLLPASPPSPLPPAPHPSLNSPLSPLTSSCSTSLPPPIPLILPFPLLLSNSLLLPPPHPYFLMLPLLTPPFTPPSPPPLLPLPPCNLSSIIRRAKQRKDLTFKYSLFARYQLIHQFSIFGSDYCLCSRFPPFRIKLSFYFLYDFCIKGVLKL